MPVTVKPPSSTSSPSTHHHAAAASSSSAATSSSTPGAPPSGGASPISASESTSSSHHRHHTEGERLTRSWRNVASSIVVAAQKAERVCGVTAASGAGAAAAPTREGLKELDDAIIYYLKSRQEWSSLLSYVEAKLVGTAEELDTLRSYNRSVPKLGINKRKRDGGNDADDQQEEQKKKQQQEDEVRQAAVAAAAAAGVAADDLVKTMTII